MDHVDGFACATKALRQLAGRTRSTASPKGRSSAVADLASDYPQTTPPELGACRHVARETLSVRSLLAVVELLIVAMLGFVWLRRIPLTPGAVSDPETSVSSGRADGSPLTPREARAP
jgi:hypothetical protein